MVLCRFWTGVNTETSVLATWCVFGNPPIQSSRIHACSWPLEVSNDFRVDWTGRQPPPSTTPDAPLAANKEISVWSPRSSLGRCYRVSCLPKMPAIAIHVCSQSIVNRILMTWIKIDSRSVPDVLMLHCGNLCTLTIDRRVRVKTNQPPNKYQDNCSTSIGQQCRHHILLISGF